MKQRFLAVFLALALCVGLTPGTAFASRRTVLEEAEDYTFGTTVSDTLTTRYTIMSYSRGYRFSIPASGAIYLSATAVDAGQFICGVFDSSYTQVWQHAEDNRTLGGMGKLVQPVNETVHLTGGDYYFVVDSYREIDYSFSMTYTAANESFPETGWGSDNSENEANEIILGVTYTGQLAENDRKDYYRFTMPKAGQLTLDVSAGQALKGGFSSGIYRYGYYRPEHSIVGSGRETIDLKAGSYYYVVSQGGIKGPYGNYSFCLSFSGSAVSGVSLSEQNLTLKVGERAELSVSVQPEDATNQRVSWSSDDNSVARVDASGRVTAVSPGRTIVTVTTEDGGYTARCHVTVEERVQKVMGVILSRSTLTLTEGDSAALTASVFPQDATNQTVSWSSSDSSVAMVDAYGQVRAISPGTATITVTTEDGGYTARCRVTVEERVRNITGVALSYSFLKLTEGDSAVLTATVFPDNATNQTVSWSSSDSSVARVDADGQVSAISPGTATITVTTEDGGYTTRCYVTVEKKAQKVTGVSLSRSSLMLTEGDSAALTATVSPRNATNQTVSWSSSDSSVARVDAYGQVSAVSPGTATITVTTEDGGHTDRCQITVEAKAGAPDPNPTPGATPAEVHFSRANVYHQDQFTDVPANQWFTGSVAEAFELGLMQGNSATTFNPDGDVTVAEAVTMACRIHAIYTAGSAGAIVPQPGNAWYQPYLDYAFQNGIITIAYYNSDVTQKATRAQFAEIFANSLPEEALPAINTIADSKIPDVPMSAYYAGSVYKLYRAGILAGGDVLGTFSPTSYITRKEAAAIVSRMAESNNRKSFTL